MYDQIIIISAQLKDLPWFLPSLILPPPASASTTFPVSFSSSLLLSLIDSRSSLKPIVLPSIDAMKSSSSTGAIGFTILIIKCQSVVIFGLTVIFQIMAFVSCKCFCIWSQPHYPLQFIINRQELVLDILLNFQLFLFTTTWIIV